jgi:4-diphosphocytidyl-2-C-methyl-D-erythritol kinase
VASFSIFAPAKLNLFLAITGRRADGFHDLVSVVARTAFGDTLEVEPAAEFSLSCDDPTIPVDETNLVLKAATLFAARTGWRGGARFRLVKRIPMGAGLGGGSSDGVAALRALSRLSEGYYDALLPELAAAVGSDCPLFLHGRPVIMRGRGDQVEPLPEATARRLRSQRVLVFKPAFGISTPWAYAQLAAAAPASYLPAPQAEARVAAWIANGAAPLDELLFNNMEPPAFRKHLALPTLLEQLRRDHGLAPRMSGSGSACFAVLPSEMDVSAICRAIRTAWGESAFVAETQLM